ncbi:MAG: Type IV pilus biogenesis protein PilQ [Candidatus Ozemobacter sibiricus]|uniref:Type IV pilus biogenesis protein PilQ n=1 Tax=Candidatus Ozemobacter sibiricus TaxID=2268124 RepID=A0A367ZQG4_9BACT|nr:MAG: Type IV pilus biogenesis protein PilQ [Candidatus Ozemobacter sibiricus]
MLAFALATGLSSPAYADRILIPLGKSFIYKTSFPVKRVFVVKQGVIDAPVVTDEEIVFTSVGTQPDSTQVILWDPNGNKLIHDVNTYQEEDILQNKFNALIGEPGVNLAIFPDVVYLRGMVDAPEKKARAEQLLKSLVGDRKVENLLEVKPSVTLAQRIQDAIKIPTVKVTVVTKKEPDPAATGPGTPPGSSLATDSKDAMIILEGTVETQNDYIRTQEIVQGFVDDPKKSVRNLLTISNPTQVVFQAYVLEMRRETTKELGIRWGSANELGGELKQGIVNFYENVSKDFRGAVQQGPAPVPDRVNPFKMNNLNRFEIIDAQINALEKAGKAKVLANPKLICYANTKPTKIAGTGWLGEGDITDGKEPTIGTKPDEDPGIAFFQTGTQREVLVGRDNLGAPLTRQYNAMLRLAIRDLFVQDDSLKFSVFAKRDDFDETTNAINTRSLSTTIKSRNGETIILGGLITKNKIVSKESVPGLSRIPYLGRLFRWERDRVEENELIVLLTPEIIGREKDALPVKKFETVPVPRRSDRLEKLHDLFQKIKASHFPEEAGR